jgi:hypothetical protein
VTVPKSIYEKLQPGEIGGREFPTAQLAADAMRVMSAHRPACDFFIPSERPRVVLMRRPAS